MFKAKVLRGYSDEELVKLIAAGLVVETDGVLWPTVSGEAAAPIWRLSGGASNSDPNASIGGIMSTTTVVPAGIFDNVTGDESAAGDIEYRGVYVLNNGDVDLQSAVVWIQANTPSTDDTIAIGLSAQGSNATMTAVANESTAPASVSFTAPATKAAGLSVGTLAAGQRYGVWIRRTVTAGAAPYNADTFTLRVEGDTAA